MADHLITILNAVNTFGPAPSTKWGVTAPNTMTWGVSKWGEGTQDLVTALMKLIGNTITPTDEFSRRPNKVLQFALPMAEDLTIESMTDGSGYSVLYPGNATNAENRVISTYSTAAAAASTYSSSSAGNTVWS